VKNKIKLIVMSLLTISLASCATAPVENQHVTPKQSFQSNYSNNISTSTELKKVSGPHITVAWNDDGQPISKSKLLNIKKNMDPVKVVEKTLTDGFKMRIAEPLKRNIANCNPVYDVVSVVNRDAKVIAYAQDQKIANALAQEQPQVFFGFKGDELRKTMNEWAKSIGYTIVWDIEYDYTISQDFVVYGPLLDDGGPLETVLESLQSTSNPIRANIKANHVILIQPSAYQAPVI